MRDRALWCKEHLELFFCLDHIQLKDFWSSISSDSKSSKALITSKLSYFRLTVWISKKGILV